MVAGGQFSLTNVKDHFARIKDWGNLSEYLLEGLRSRWRNDGEGRGP